MVMITLFPICYLSQLKHLDMNAIVLGKHMRLPYIHKAKTIGPLGMKKRNELYSLCSTSVTSVYFFTVVYILYILHVFPK